MPHETKRKLRFCTRSSKLHELSRNHVLGERVKRTDVPAYRPAWQSDMISNSLQQQQAEQKAKKFPKSLWCVLEECRQFWVPQVIEHPRALRQENKNQRKLFCSHECLPRKKDAHSLQVVWPSLSSSLWTSPGLDAGTACTLVLCRIQGATLCSAEKGKALGRCLSRSTFAESQWSGNRDLRPHSCMVFPLIFDVWKCVFVHKSPVLSKPHPHQWYLLHPFSCPLTIGDIQQDTFGTRNISNEKSEQSAHIAHYSEATKGSLTQQQRMLRSLEKPRRSLSGNIMTTYQSDNIKKCLLTRTAG